MHGIPPDFYKPEACGVSESSFGFQLGNCVSVNVLMRYWPRALHSAGLVEAIPPVDYWERAVAMMHAVQKTNVARRA